MITNTTDYLISYGDLLYDASKFRQQIDIKNTCRYGINILDQYLGGILPSELVVIGADTGCGKSELAYNIAINNAKRGKKVLLLALEGDIYEIAYRHFQREINKIDRVKTIDYRFNLNEDISNLERDILEHCIEDSIKENLYVYNKKEVPSLEFIKELIITMRDNVDMIILDHLHYISFENSNSENYEIGKVMRELKQVTDNIRKPIVLMSHLRKGDNKDKGRDPTNWDLYGSSNIAKEATTILLITKNDGYFPEDEYSDKRYSQTKIISSKSRIGLPYSQFALVFDRYGKEYTNKQELIEENSSSSTEDRIDESILGF